MDTAITPPRPCYGPGRDPEAPTASNNLSASEDHLMQKIKTINQYMEHNDPL